MQYRHYVHAAEFRMSQMVYTDESGVPILEDERKEYAADKGWKAYPDYPSARDALPDQLWIVENNSNQEPFRELRGYAVRLKDEGVAEIYERESEARAAWDAIEWKWGVNGYNVVRVHPGNAYAMEQFGRLYAKRETAERHIPAKVWALKRFEPGSAPFLVQPNQRNADPRCVYADSGQGCYDLLPELYQWNGSAYVRERVPGISWYREARNVIRAARNGDTLYSVLPNAGRYDRARTYAGLESLYERISQHTDCERGEFLTRLSVLNSVAEFYLCPCCDDSFCDGEIQDPDGDAVCAPCFDSYYCRCASCGTVMRYDDSFSDGDGDSYCEDHYEYEDEDSGDLMAHNVRINSRKQMFLKHESERKADLYLGWELECYPSEGKRRSLVVARVRDAFGAHCIVKRDGSLNDNGLEIVSVAATLKWHQEHARRFLENVKGELAGWKHDSAGIHVHIGLKETSKLQQARCATFIGDAANQKFLNHIAGRDANNYAQRYKKKLSAHRNAPERYGALNFDTYQSETMEFRLFRSNVAPLGFLKNLEFCHALTTWARYAGNLEVASAQEGVRFPPGRMSVRVNGAAEPWRLFVEWIARNRTDYRNLYRWMQENGYAEGLRSTPVSVAA
jgi:hypothetical protein